ncbi:MAG: phosphoenolpyruvate carboxykinase [Brevinema sp.]
MPKEFDIVRAGALLNFNLKYCHSSFELLESKGFYRLLKNYLEQSEKNDTLVYQYFSSVYDGDDLLENLIEMLKILSIQQLDEEYPLYLRLVKDTAKFITFIEEFYSYWLKIERYAVLYYDRPSRTGLKRGGLITSIDELTNLIINTRRKIKKHVSSKASMVLRQSRSSVNAGIGLARTPWKCPDNYGNLLDIPFIQKLVLMPPFIVYPKMNTRKGTFNEVTFNPIENIHLDSNEWFCYPVKVGKYLTFAYFPKEFMSQGITLCNLFETASPEEYENKKPDIVYIYAYDNREPSLKTDFYHDKKNDIMVGFINRSNEIDYFGYMKKMLLTLHNVKALGNKELPIHGAMVKITLKNGVSKNVVIMGDSGAGKSESLEAFRYLAQDYLQKMVIIFDDMGILKLDKDKPLAYGTEIGAFVRLDDLDQGYAYKELDRSIFMNPDKINARVIIPVSTYDEIMAGEPIDYFLYANNYDDSKEAITFFDKIEPALDTFISGKRMAKGTTSETGIVESFFANPFGPVQREEESRILINNYFKDMFAKGVKVGMIHTRLGIAGQEQSGPKDAAKSLFDMILSEHN